MEDIYSRRNYRVAATADISQPAAYLRDGGAMSTIFLVTAQMYVHIWKDIRPLSRGDAAALNQGDKSTALPQRRSIKLRASLSKPFDL